jgi:hypothetical protein
MPLRAHLLFVLAAAFASAAVMDRIAVSVGKLAILESEVESSARIAAFLDQKPVELTGETKRHAAERLVDQALILREASGNRVALPNANDATQLLEQVKLQFGAEYQASLVRYGITEAGLRNHLLSGFRMLRFTDLRFRPEVQVSEEELREFYQLLAAGWRRGKNAQVPAFDESREQVQKMLLDQKATQALDTWLSSARTQVGVSYRTRVFE